MSPHDRKTLTQASVCKVCY